MRLPLVIKLPAIIVFVVIVSLVIVNGIWIFTTQNRLTESIKNDVKTTSGGTEKYVDSYFKSKIASLASYAYEQEVLNGDVKTTQAVLQNALKQDNDILEIQLLSDRREVVHVSQN